MTEKLGFREGSVEDLKFFFAGVEENRWRKLLDTGLKHDSPEPIHQEKKALMRIRRSNPTAAYVQVR